jgi:DNA polymerase-3 subunit delta
MAKPAAHVHLLTGDDPSLLADTLHALIHELLAGEDRDVALVRLGEDDYRIDDGSFHLAPLIDAAQTPPFLTAHRVVVGHHLGRFAKADELAPLLAVLADPLATTRLILVWERGQTPRQDRLGAVPKKLVEAVRAVGGRIHETGVPSGKAADSWLDERLDQAAVRLDRAARTLVHQRLGEDRARVVGVLHTLESAFGPGATVTAAELEPFLGEAGAVPPWELTDAIDSGNIPDALDKLHRMLGAGDRHPLQVLATLHTHYGRMLRVEGVPGLDERSAANLLGMKGSTFPAKKALTQCRRLSGGRVQQAVRLLGDADLALRGAVAWPPELVMEVLVARLANLVRR